MSLRQHPFRYVNTTSIYIRACTQPTANAQQNHKRKVIWYNPPWNTNVKTNLGRKFINIINRCFPKEHPLHKTFNKHTLKFSYSCMANIKSIISSHNKAVLSNFYQSQTQTNDKEWNYRKKDTTRQSYQISTSHKHKQMTKNETVEKKTSAH